MEQVQDETQESARDVAAVETTDRQQSPPRLAQETLIDCGNTLDISTVKTLWESLLPALEEKKPIVFVTENISSADTAALQLLLAFVNDARASGVAFSWGEPSEVLQFSAKILGLSDQLSLQVS